MSHTPSLLLAALVVPLAACGGSSESPSATTPDDGTEVVDLASAAEPGCPEAGDEWEVAKLYIEHNATDDDTGVHGLIGGEAWRELCVFDPSGNQIWWIDPQAQLDELAVADLFFESREPAATEYSVDDLRHDFPEGSYVVSGTDFEGVARVGAATFTHDIPAPPEILAPAFADDADTADQATVPTGALVVEWEPVTETIDGEQVTITGYEIIITMEEFDDPNGWSRPVYDVHVGPDLTSLTVPAEFLATDTVYELEVLALEQSGNQTITVGFFRTS